MQLSTLVTWLAALTVGAQAVSFGNNLKDQIILDSEESSPDLYLESVFKDLGSLPVDLITAWAEMQSELSPEQIAKLINQYESKMKNQRKISLIQCRHFLHQVPSLKSFPMINLLVIQCV